MGADIGPGVRLLCVWTHEGGPLRVGTVYACKEVLSTSPFSMCSRHGVGSCFGVLLEEVPDPDMDSYTLWAWASCCFRPIGGSLPEEITRQLDVDPSFVTAPDETKITAPPKKERVKEPA